jgi:Spindle and kinetochore-associated protein 1
MRGRLTLEKINIAINEVATYADSNAHLISCSTKKVYMLPVLTFFLY